MVVLAAAGFMMRRPISTCSLLAEVRATAVTRYPRIAGVPGIAAAGVQLTLMVLMPLGLGLGTVSAATTLVGAGGPDCSGPFGQPPIPGPPGSPFSAMVMPWRLAAGSVTSQAIARSPRPASAASVADSTSSKTYVATKVFG